MRLQGLLPLTWLLFMALRCPMTHAFHVRVTHPPVVPEGGMLPTGDDDALVNMSMRDEGPTHPPVVPEGGMLPTGEGALVNVSVGADGRVVMTATRYQRGASHLASIRQGQESPAMCGTYQMAAGQTLTIASPNHPESYPNDFWCQWTFIAADGGELAMTCPNFDLVQNDFLEVKHIQSQNAVKYSEQTAPEITSTEGSRLVISFKSNCERNATGFTCTVSQLDDSTTTPTTTTSPTITPITTSTTTTPTTTTSTTTTPTTTTPSPLSHPDCGRVGTARIVNGQETTENKYPWMVWLRMSWTDGLIRSCGGSIILERWILTAAHCTFRTNRARTALLIPSVEVAVGGHVLNDPAVHQGYWVSSEAVFMHPELRLQYDIALIRLQAPLTFTTTIAPVCLPPRSLASDDLAGESVTISGWGLTETGELAARLREYDTVGYSFSLCQEFYGSWMLPTQMCTDGSARKHTCSGDSGGPVMSDGPQDRVMQVGVVSFGSSSGCDDTAPDGQVRLAAFISWIELVTGVTFPQ